MIIRSCLLLHSWRCSCLCFRRKYIFDLWFMCLMVLELFDIAENGSFLVTIGGLMMEWCVLVGWSFVSCFWIRKRRSVVDSFFLGVSELAFSVDLDLFLVVFSVSESYLWVSLDVLVSVEFEDDDEDDDDDDDEEDEESDELRLLDVLWSWRHPKSSANVMNTFACGCGIIASGPYVWGTMW